MGRDSEFDAARGLEKGIRGRQAPRQTKPSDPAPAARIADLLTTRVDEDPEITRRATELVKAKIAERRDNPPGKRLSLRDRVPRAERSRRP